MSQHLNKELDDQSRFSNTLDVTLEEDSFLQKREMESVQVCVRIRKLNQREESSLQPVCVLKDQAQKGRLTIGHTGENSCGSIDLKEFLFDDVIGPEANQQDIFEKVGKRMVSACLSGYNVCLFAYGQTGAGKTYTMLGNEGEQGLIQKMVNLVFARLKSKQREFIINCQFFEIYMEEIIDLLTINKNKNIRVVEDFNGVRVDNLVQIQINNHLEAIELIQKGQKNRHVASTSMNKESSRSHSIFSMNISFKEKDSASGVIKEKTAKLHFVDLAGSERQKQTQATGKRLKEASQINQSLTSLGIVIHSLSEGRKNICYRNSKLTHILKDSLGGNSKTLMIAAVSPSADSYGETLSTLKFAARVKFVKNVVVVNERASESVDNLKKEIVQLQLQLEQQLKIQKLQQEQIESQNSIFQNNQNFIFKEQMKEQQKEEKHKQDQDDINIIAHKISEFDAWLREFFETSGFIDFISELRSRMGILIDDEQCVESARDVEIQQWQSLFQLPIDKLKLFINEMITFNQLIKQFHLQNELNEQHEQQIDDNIERAQEGVHLFQRKNEQITHRKSEGEGQSKLKEEILKIKQININLEKEIKEINQELEKIQERKEEQVVQLRNEIDIMQMQNNNLLEQLEIEQQNLLMMREECEIKLEKRCNDENIIKYKDKLIQELQAQLKEQQSQIQLIYKHFDVSLEQNSHQSPLSNLRNYIENLLSDIKTEKENKEYIMQQSNKLLQSINHNQVDNINYSVSSNSHNHININSNSHLQQKSQQQQSHQQLKLNLSKINDYQYLKQFLQQMQNNYNHLFQQQSSNPQSEIQSSSSQIRRVNSEQSSPSNSRMMPLLSESKGNNNKCRSFSKEWRMNQQQQHEFADDDIINCGSQIFNKHYQNMQFDKNRNRVNTTNSNITYSNSINSSDKGNGTSNNYQYQSREFNSNFNSNFQSNMSNNFKGSANSLESEMEEKRVLCQELVSKLEEISKLQQNAQQIEQFKSKLDKQILLYVALDQQKQNIEDELENAREEIQFLKQIQAENIQRIQELTEQLEDSNLFYQIKSKQFQNKLQSTQKNQIIQMTPPKVPHPSQSQQKQNNNISNDSQDNLYIHSLEYNNLSSQKSLNSMESDHLQTGIIQSIRKKLQQQEYQQFQQQQQQQESQYQQSQKQVANSSCFTPKNNNNNNKNNVMMMKQSNNQIQQDIFKSNQIKQQQQQQQVEEVRQLYSESHNKELKDRCNILNQFDKQNLLNVFQQQSTPSNNSHSTDHNNKKPFEDSELSNILLRTNSEILSDQRIVEGIHTPQKAQAFHHHNNNQNKKDCKQISQGNQQSSSIQFYSAKSNFKNDSNNYPSIIQEVNEFQINNVAQSQDNKYSQQQSTNIQNIKKYQSDSKAIFQPIRGNQRLTLSDKKKEKESLHFSLSEQRNIEQILTMIEEIEQQSTEKQKCKKKINKQKLQSQQIKQLSKSEKDGQQQLNSKQEDDSYELFENYSSDQSKQLNSQKSSSKNKRSFLQILANIDEEVSSPSKSQIDSQQEKVKNHVGYSPDFENVIGEQLPQKKHFN